MWRSLIFEKKLFAADFGQKRPEKEVFEDFFEVGSIVFSDFLHKDGHLNTLECDGTRFLRNIFSRLILAKNGLKKRFLINSPDWFIIFSEFLHKVGYLDTYKCDRTRLLILAENGLKKVFSWFTKLFLKYILTFDLNVALFDIN